MKNINVGILGGTGYVGGELYRILRNHPNFDIKFVSSESKQGYPVESLNKSLITSKQKSNLKYSSIKDLPDNLDCLFSALPTGVLPNYIKDILKKVRVVFNISGDFRFHDKDILKKYYPQTYKLNCTDIISEYCIPDIDEYSHISRDTNLINLPGCMALACIYAFYPLVKHKLIKNNVFVDVKTGSSGAGKSTKETAADRFGNFRLYRAFDHRHLPEVINVLSPQVTNIGFAAYSLDISRGIYASAYSLLKDNITSIDVKKSFYKEYKYKKFIVNLSNNTIPLLKSVNGTNSAEIKVIVSGKMCISMVALDNLIKGAAGQAIQAANKYYLLDEELGLNNLCGMWP